jgi:hypothetical protein
MKVGGALLANDPGFPALLQVTGGALAAPLPTLAEACSAL